jgi:DNA protecting protein DprA
MSDILVYWKWLSKVLGAAARNTDEVLEFVQYNPVEAYEQMGVIYEQKLITKNQYKNSQSTTLEEVKTEIKKENDAGIQVIGYSDEFFPPLLRNISAPPLVLHVKGNIKYLHDNICISVVGTRRPSAYGNEVIDVIASGLAQAGVIVVSGLAAGLDSVAHKAAISRNLPTVAVVGGGLDIYYPAANRKLQQLIEKFGAVISEYSLGERPERHHFLERNRIIAGLSHGLCVAEARKYSGTMSTVRYALDANRDVFAIPGSVFSPLSEGTNALIKEGAYCVTSADDILLVYGINMHDDEKHEEDTLQKLPEKAQVSETAKQVYTHVNREEKNLERICELTELSPAEVLAALSELELEGLVLKLPGQRYTLHI